MEKKSERNDDSDDDNFNLFRVVRSEKKTSPNSLSAGLEIFHLQPEDYSLSNMFWQELTCEESLAREARTYVCCTRKKI